MTISSKLRALARLVHTEDYMLGSSPGLPSPPPLEGLGTMLITCIYIYQFREGCLESSRERGDDRERAGELQQVRVDEKLPISRERDELLSDEGRGQAVRRGRAGGTGMGLSGGCGMGMGNGICFSCRSWNGKYREMTSSSR